jgi:DNA-binding NarL/FixJ family response regulator
MKILIIDDSDYKVEGLMAVIADFSPHANVSVARSFRSGVESAKKSLPDLMLLDMTLPTFEIGSTEAGGRTRPFGGREILRELDAIGLKTRVIIVTQFDRFGERNQSRDELMNELREEFPDCFVGGVYYSVVDSAWRQALVELLKQLPDWQ